MNKSANIKNRYNPANLFQGSYGTIVYVPKVDLLSQLSLDPSSLTERFKGTKEHKKNVKDDATSGPNEYDYSNLTIKVPVPPPPSDAMVNPRTKRTYPLGTKADPDTGEELRQIDSVMQERNIRNQIIYSDPSQSIVYYVDKTGMIDSIQMGHLVELTENRNLILSVLELKIQVKDEFKSPSGLRQKWKSSKLEELFYVDPKDTSHDAVSRRERLKAMCNVDLDQDGGVPLFMYAKSPEFKEYVHSQLRDLETKFKAGTASVKNDMLDDYYAQLITAVLFADKHGEYFMSLLQEEDKALSVDPANAPEVPHIKQDTRFLPHQSYALSFLKDRKVAMVDADPGAGKTLMFLADILDKMNRGLVSRPCLVMPNALLSDQKAELEDWTQGTVNFIVINTQTVKQMDPEAQRLQRGPRKGLPGEGGKNAGLMALTKMIREAPKNTILMTSYEWLRGGQEDQVKTASGVRYRHPSWLTTRIGVDMLVLDESHAVRINASGKASGRAEAVLQMSSLVPYKRCYSGTITPGSPDDVFLQMSFLDPSVLGPRKPFLKRYALSTTRSDKVEEFKPGAIKQIQETISRRVGVSIRRSAWLGELPDMQVNYHKATLTGPQRIVYERLLDRIIREELLGELEPGTVGLELQRAMKDQYASNPLARDKISQWQKPATSSITEYDDQSGDFVEADYDLGEAAEEHKVLRDVWKEKGSGNITDQTRIEAFKQAQVRISKLWKRYEDLQGETEDAPDVEDFKPLLTKFIAIDKFLNYPPGDEFGQHFLVEDQDRESPKIRVIDQLLTRHFNDPNSGKVIIFTHYKEVARHISETIQMSSRAVYYEAGETKALSRFKTDPSVQILVAVEQSIQEGQNLQMANRIIRVDLPWNPGNYEQSIARAYRLPPKDPDAPRHSTVYVDLILCEGTAELTKFARMVSKMHAVRQFISGYTSGSRFRLVGMSLENMQDFNTFAAVQRHIDAFKEIRDYEKEEAKLAPKIFGADTRTLATGAEMEGSEKLETPYVESDLNRGPWTVKPSKMKKGIINPKLVYFNGGYWLTMEYIDGMKFILEGFEKMETEGVLTCIFGSAPKAFEILASLREKGIHVVNQQELYAKIYGKIPIDPAFPQSRIDYQKLVRKAHLVTAEEAPSFRPNDPVTRKQILAYDPSQENLKVARELLTRASRSDKPVTDLVVLAAAKILGLFNLNPQTIDVDNFSRQAFRFTVFPNNKKVLQDQLSALVPAAPPSTLPVQEDDESSEIPGLDISPSPAGIPIQLEVSIIGRLRSGKLVTSPAFMIQDTSAFLAPGLMEPALKIMESLGFKRNPSSLRWLFLGENRAQAKSRLEDFSRLVYIWYTIGNPDEYINMLRDVGFTNDDIERVFPREEITAMVKRANLLRSYPEYRELTQLVYDPN